MLVVVVVVGSVGSISHINSSSSSGSSINNSTVDARIIIANNSRCTRNTTSGSVGNSVGNRDCNIVGSRGGHVSKVEHQCCDLCFSINTEKK